MNKTKGCLIANFATVPTEMAAKLEVAAGYLSAVERGVKPISEALLIKIANAFTKSAREKDLLREVAAASQTVRRIPPNVDMKAYFYLNELWMSISELEEEDWAAMHSLFDVIARNHRRKKEEAA